MKHSTCVRRLHGHLRLWIAAVAALVLSGSAWAWSPSFENAPWTPLGCGDFSEPLGDTGPGAVDLVGDAAHPATYVAQDNKFLFFRFRVNNGVWGDGGFGQYAWTVLLRLAGDPFAHEYALLLNGVGSDDDLGHSDTDNVEAWVTQPALARLYAQQYDFASWQTLNSTPLARTIQAGDGSNFGGDPDYFVDFAVPLGELIYAGVIASAADLDGAVFFPQTGTGPTTGDRDALECPFLPDTTLALVKDVDKGSVCTNVATPVVYTLAATTTGSEAAHGVVIEDDTLPSFTSTPTVTVSSADPSVTSTVESVSPVVVRVPVLPAGATVTVRIATEATPGCNDTDATNEATVRALNANEVADSTTLGVGTCPEVCDGVDNDCNGEVDEGGDALCANDDACDGDETCAGADGCQPGTVPDCADDNACTVDTCDPSSGCVNTAKLDCTPCSEGEGCSDGDVCTGDVCTAAGICEFKPKGDCFPCEVAADCDDHNPCTNETCGADGSCKTTVISECRRCDVPTDCDDHDACTDETCPDGTCHSAPSPSCAPKEEICGNCIDDDGNGLADFEDPACCPELQRFAMTLQRGRIVPKTTTTSKLRLKSSLGRPGRMEINPRKQDVFVQIRPANGADLLCAQIPAAKFTSKGRKFRFKDRKLTVASAKGLTNVNIKLRKDGTVRFRARGKQTKLTGAKVGPLQVTVGFHNAAAGDTENRCSMTLQPFRAGKQGKLVAP